MSARCTVSSFSVLRLTPGLFGFVAEEGVEGGCEGGLVEALVEGFDDGLGSSRDASSASSSMSVVLLPVMFEYYVAASEEAYVIPVVPFESTGEGSMLVGYGETARESCSDDILFMASAPLAPLSRVGRAPRTSCPCW